MNGISFLPVGPSALNALPPSMLPATSHTAVSSAPPSSQTRSGSSSADSNPGNSATPAKPAAATAPASSNTTMSAANLAELAVAESFSTTVGGKQYSGSVELSNGEYTASVPNLIGATATGSSESAAENNLDARIDVLV
jgi:hypothetical protein